MTKGGYRNSLLVIGLLLLLAGIGFLQTAQIAFAITIKPSIQRAQPSSYQQIGCTSTIKTYPIPEPAEDEVAARSNTPQIRAHLSLTPEISINIVEHPTQGSLSYKTEVVIKHADGREKHYHVAELIGNPRLRFVHAASVCSSSKTKTIVLEYEGNPTGSIEGFALIRYYRGNVKVYPLPIAHQGKVVIFKCRLNYLEIWTTAPGGSITSAVSERLYRVRSCYLRGDTFICNSGGQIVGPYDPGSVDDPGIEIK